jgi:hypothetical protein
MVDALYAESKVSISTITIQKRKIEFIHFRYKGVSLTDRNIPDFHTLILKCLCIGAISLNLKIQREKRQKNLLA